MINPQTLLDEIVSIWQSMPSVTAIIPATGISAYVADYSPGLTSVNLEARIIEQPVSTILVCHTGTRTGAFAKADTIKHDFAAYLKPNGRPGDLFLRIREGVVPASGLKFKLHQVDFSVQPPSELSYQRKVYVIGQGYALYEAWELAFTLVERGIDN